MSSERSFVLIRGGGDLATGIAARLHRAGVALVVTEIAKPRAVRRLVALAEAIYSQEVQIEDLHGKHVLNAEGVWIALEEGVIPILVDPGAKICQEIQIVALVDARMRKRPSELGLDFAPMMIGVGPGFTAGVDCHAVVETNRGHHLGRVYWEGSAEPDTGVPEPVLGRDVDRVLRAPAPGNLRTKVALGARVKAGELIATVNGVPLKAPFEGVLRGLVHDTVEVKLGEKVGDLDPRGEASYCYQISDKSLAVGGGVLEALLNKPNIRQQLWD